MSSAKIKARINSGRTIQASTVAIGSAGKLNELSDLDTSQLNQGAMIVWNDALQKWVAKPEIEDGTSLNGGRY